jgi:hypothetical protein
VTDPNDRSLIDSGEVPRTYENDVRGTLKAGGYMFLRLENGFNMWLFKKYFVPTYTTADFRLGSKEKVGEHLAQVIKFRLIDRVDKDLMISESLWLDLKTNLPLKRVTKIWRGEEQPDTYAETYSEFAINPKIEPKVFELPKK